VQNPDLITAYAQLLIGVAAFITSIVLAARWSVKLRILKARGKGKRRRRRRK